VDDAIDQAVAILRRGGLVAFPTETVYGLGADASNPAAVTRIFAAKGRPADHPLIVHLGRIEELSAWARAVPDAAWKLARAFWPGPLTLILPRAAGVCDAVTGGQDTVGLRIPSHPVAQRLLRAFGGGIAAPSANRFGRLSPTTAAHVREELGDRVDSILDGGPCVVGIESTIVDLSTGQPILLRPGHIGIDALVATTGLAVGSPTSHAPRASGTLAAHYAPTRPLRLVAAGDLEAECRREASVRAVAVLARRPAPPNGMAHTWRVAANEATEYARELYAALRDLDRSGCDIILVESPPDQSPWAAIHDRLRRSAAGAGTGNEDAGELDNP